MRNTVRYSPPARCTLDGYSRQEQDYITRSIDDMAQEPVVRRQMVVNGWTDSSRPHIYRAFKLYAFGGFRAIFHRIFPNTVYIDRLARRCDDPYLDNH